jgi:cell division protein FtsL
MAAITPAGRVGQVGRPVHAVQAAVQADMGNRRGIGVGAFVLALVTAGAMAHVGVRMKGIEVAYDLGRERRINTQLEEERRRLNIEIGMLKDPVRVVGIARDKLNMGPPAATDIVRLGPGQILGERREPALVPAKKPEHAAKAPVARAGARAAKPVAREAQPAAEAKPSESAAEAEAKPPAVEASPSESDNAAPTQAAPGREGDE